MVPTLLFMLNAPARCATPDAQPVTLLQPVQEYFASSIGYTHLGTQYGVMGPGEDSLSWQDGTVCVALPEGQWAGMWHVLPSHQADQASFDFSRCYPALINPSHQPRCTAIIIKVRGTGGLKLEIKGRDDAVLWVKQGFVRASSAARRFRIPLRPSNKLHRAKFLSWIAEPGANLCIDSLSLQLQFPKMTDVERVFLKCYAKLAQCYNQGEGTVRDRAYQRFGEFDTVPTSGLFCLATCAAWKLGIVSREFAGKTLHEIKQRMEALPTAGGLLPHFLRKIDGEIRIAPGTEYSSVDTSIYYHSMLLAAQMLGDNTAVKQLTASIRKIDFSRLRNDDGFVIHGFKDDGITPLKSVWADWGGETALVLMLQAMGAGPRIPPKMKRDGRVFRGVGFIAEIQSLFYSQFSSSRRDAVSGINWKSARRTLFLKQQRYSPADSAARQLGVFGLSAGEAFRGQGYVANGVENSDVNLIHPHYMLLGWEHWQSPRELVELLTKLEQKQLFPPFGLVENVTADLSEYLPYIGSLNAGMESIAAYHLLVAESGTKDEIYHAANSCPATRAAIRLFYRRSR